MNKKMVILNDRIEQLRMVRSVASLEIEDPYTHGLANGLILAESIMDGSTPKYIGEIPCQISSQISSSGPASPLSSSPLE
jgi:hypothetical protein